MNVMTDRSNQVWGIRAEPGKIRVLLHPIPRQSDDDNETYMTFYVETSRVEEFDTEALEDDELYERLV